MSFVDGDLLFSVVVVCIKRTSANLRLADERHTLKVVTLAPLTQESSSVARGTGSGGPTAMRRRLARSSRRAGWRRAPHSLFRATAGPHLSAPRQRIAKRFRTPAVRRILPASHARSTSAGSLDSRRIYRLILMPWPVAHLR